MLKITQSLISAWDYWNSSTDETRDEAYASFLAKIRREPSPDTVTTANGRFFEDAIRAEVEGKPFPNWLLSQKGMADGVAAIAPMVHGATFQMNLFRRFSVGTHEMILHGVADAVKAGTIYDFKLKTKSFHSTYLPGSYLNSSQHPAYFFAMPEAREFVYLVSDGCDLYTERYIPSEVTPFPAIATEFIDSLKALGLFETYCEKWEVRG